MEHSRSVGAQAINRTISTIVQLVERAMKENESYWQAPCQGGCCVIRVEPGDALKAQAEI